VIPAQRSDEGDLIARARDGDRQAFGELYRIHSPFLFRFVSYRVPNHAMAEDIVSTTFTKALGRIGSFTNTGTSIAAWFATIARNLIADYYKSSRYHRETLTGDVLGGDLVDNGHAPDAVLIEREMAAAIRLAVKILTAEQLQVVELKYFRGLADAEIAAVIGKDVGAVKALAMRARRAMRARAPGLEAVR